ncbi:Bifunctional methionine biosynthesis protein MetXA/MetW [Thermoflexales bacterium]|nr:Bifunctional methionine biosynthesis protein MetXA/MetW [Thermoflexales bacterium]
MSRTGLRADLGVIASLIEPEEKVLDLGCGDGSLLRYLIDTKRIVGRGVELAEAKVLACVRNGVAVRQGDLHEELRDYPEQAFDTVILSYGLPYLNDPAFIVTNMLRVGKRAVVSFPNWGHWRCRLSLLLRGHMPSAPGDPQAWDAAPRARGLTIADFTTFCTARQIRVVTATFLQGTRRVPARFDTNLRATWAVFELR